MRALFVFAILLPGMVIALFDRFRALLLYLWFAFFRPQEWVWFNITSWRLSLVLALILIVPSMLSGEFPSFGHPLMVGALLLLVCGLMAQSNAINQPLGWYWIQFFAQLILICAFMITLIKKPRDLMRVIAVVAGSLGFFATKAGLISLLAGGAQFSAGLSGAFADSNGYALGTVMIIPFLLAIGQNAELTFEGLVPRRLIVALQYLCYVSVPLCIYTVICTFSRAGFLALLAGVLMYVWLQRRRFWLTVGLVAIAVVVVRFVPMPEGYAARLDSIPVEEVVVGTNEDDSLASPLEDTAEGRLHFWRVALDMVAAHPLGVGMRNYEPNYNTFDYLRGKFGRRRAVHSSHFQVLAELGYLGAVIWVALFAYAFRVAFRTRRRSRHPGLAPPMARFVFTMSTAIMVSMVGFVIGGGFISLALNDLTWVTFALLVALDRLSARLCLEAEQKAVEPVAKRLAPVARQRMAVRTVNT